MASRANRTSRCKSWVLDNLLTLALALALALALTLALTVALALVPAPALAFSTFLGMSPLSLCDPPSAVADYATTYDILVAYFQQSVGLSGFTGGTPSATTILQSLETQIDRFGIHTYGRVADGNAFTPNFKN